MTILKHQTAWLAAFFAVAGGLPNQAMAGELPLSVRSNFRIGDAGVRCTAQNASSDTRINGMFDRGYRLTCRDAAGSVGSLLVLRSAATIDALLPAARKKAACSAPESILIENVGSVEKVSCDDADSGVTYNHYRHVRGDTTYYVEGLAGYDPALKLALSSVYNDRQMAGLISVAQTEVSDAAAFARVQAGSLNASDARTEAYRRNNSGRYAESGQFFENLVTRSRSNPRSLSEALANQALQQSNLGDFNASERLFGEAEEALAENEGVSQRLLRNYRALDALNQRFPEGAIAILEAEMSEITNELDFLSIRDGVIDNPLATQINRENLALQRLGGIDLVLSDRERAAILDGQATALSGTAARQMGDLVKADMLLRKADKAIAAIRDGKVASARWMRSEIALERALIAEARGQEDFAIRAYDKAAIAISRRFPQSPALLATQARKAAFLQRVGRIDEAKALYARVVDRSANVTDSGASLRNLLLPYFELLATDGSAEASTALFRATHILQRPGVAQTQAILARQMSEGDDEASSLFRLSLRRSREIARTGALVDRLTAVSEPTAKQVEALAAAQESVTYLSGEQTNLLAKLSAFPRFRALAPAQLELADLRAELRPNEAYYKLIVAGEDVYALWVRPDGARSFRVEGGLDALDTDVSYIRDSIVVIEDGQTTTYPFDVERARDLYQRLFGVLGEELNDVEHIVFEPDGPMLQLPPQLLIASQQGVDSYTKNVDEKGGDPYDYRGIDWLGKSREVSIAVSPRGFIDIRNIAPSKGRRAYLGVGSNAIPEASRLPTDRCGWPLATWQDPIASDELHFAASKFGKGQSAVATGQEFSDTALLENKQLSDYRVLHFATHGLVTAPDPSCPARPALVTSFGGEQSDGLLTFKEIFDLQLDADAVILSACDTAGMATVSASREAGITGGGNYALDGLVRAFVGAGARSVVASHWPVPDDYDATQRLIEGMIDTSNGDGLVKALAGAQRKLMVEAETSHPFYWAAFIVLGDGTRSLARE